MTAIIDNTTRIDVGVVLVHDPEFIQNAVGFGHLQGWDVFHDVPETLEVLPHLTTTASDEALLRIPCSVERAAGF